MIYHDPNFRKFVDHGNSDGIWYTIRFLGDSNDAIKFRMSYHSGNIWGKKGIQDKKYVSCWYRDVSLFRSEFTKLDFHNEAEAMTCFTEAINEFNKVENYRNFRNKANAYLIKKARKTLGKIKINI
ncbi:hypothetical protein KKG58_00900 [Patescibacteria group bacterium]|nr:hypothetical protein [Patescibacteria group bacterium]